uniref:Uncharacterized protein n=1 Tax=viral metagenome TaxID=1070528 RepID=A0A6C0JDM4_9ZZZZ
MACHLKQYPKSDSIVRTKKKKFKKSGRRNTKRNKIQSGGSASQLTPLPSQNLTKSKSYLLWKALENANYNYDFCKGVISGMNSTLADYAIHGKIMEDAETLMSDYIHQILPLKEEQLSTSKESEISDISQTNSNKIDVINNNSDSDSDSDDDETEGEKKLRLSQEKMRRESEEQMKKLRELRAKGKFGIIQTGQDKIAETEFSQMKQTLMTGGDIITDQASNLISTSNEMNPQFYKVRMDKKFDPNTVEEKTIREDYLAMMLAELKQPFENNHDFRKSNLKSKPLLSKFDEIFSRLFTENSEIIAYKELKTVEPVTSLLKKDLYTNEFGYMISIFNYLNSVRVDDIFFWKSFSIDKSKLKDSIKKWCNKKNGYIYDIKPEGNDDDDGDDDDTEYFYCTQNLKTVRNSPYKLGIEKLHYQFKDAGDNYKRLLPLFDDNVSEVFAVPDEEYAYKSAISVTEGIGTKSIKTMFPFIGQLVNSAMLLDPATRPPVSDNDFNLSKLQKIQSAQGHFTPPFQVPNMKTIKQFQLLLNLNYDKAFITRIATTRVLNGMFKRHGVSKDLVQEEELTESNDSDIIEDSDVPNNDISSLFNVGFKFEADKYTALIFKVQLPAKTSNDTNQYEIYFKDFEISNIDKYVTSAENDKQPTDDSHLRLWRLARLVYDNILPNKGIRSLKNVEPNTIFKMIVLSFKADGDANQVEFVRHLKNVLIENKHGQPKIATFLNELVDKIFISTNDKNTFTQAVLYDTPSLLIGPSFKSVDVDIEGETTLNSAVSEPSSQSIGSAVASVEETFKSFLNAIDTMENESSIEEASIIEPLLGNKTKFHADTQSCISTYKMLLDDTPERVRINISTFLKDLFELNVNDVNNESIINGNEFPVIPSEKLNKYLTESGVKEFNLKLNNTIGNDETVLESLKTFRKLLVDMSNAKNFILNYNTQIECTKEILHNQLITILTVLTEVSPRGGVGPRITSQIKSLLCKKGNKHGCIDPKEMKNFSNRAVFADYANMYISEIDQMLTNEKKRKGQELSKFLNYIRVYEGDKEINNTTIASKVVTTMNKYVEKVESNEVQANLKPTKTIIFKKINLLTNPDNAIPSSIATDLTDIFGIEGLGSNVNQQIQDVLAGNPREVVTGISEELANVHASYVKKDNNEIITNPYYDFTYSIETEIKNTTSPINETTLERVIDNILKPSTILKSSTTLHKYKCLPAIDVKNDYKTSVEKLTGVTYFKWAQLFGNNSDRNMMKLLDELMTELETNDIFKFISDYHIPVKDASGKDKIKKDGTIQTKVVIVQSTVTIPNLILSHDNFMDNMTGLLDIVKANNNTDLAEDIYKIPKLPEEVDVYRKISKMLTAFEIIQKDSVSASNVYLTVYEQLKCLNDYILQYNDIVKEIQSAALFYNNKMSQERERMENTLNINVKLKFYEVIRDMTKDINQELADLNSYENESVMMANNSNADTHKADNTPETHTSVQSASSGQQSSPVTTRSQSRAAANLPSSSRMTRSQTKAAAGNNKGGCGRNWKSGSKRTRKRRKRIYTLE